MNLVLLFDDDFVAPGRVRLTGRRLRHVREIHRAKSGDELTVGAAGGRIGRGRVTFIDEDALEMDVALDGDPPQPLPLTLILAVPRPKVLNRVIAGAASLGIKRIFLINAWRVEKSYWSSPRIAPDNLRAQSILGLEQARDTILPVIETRRLFRPFVENELPLLAAGTRCLVAHPHARAVPPRHVHDEVTLAVGPEGGWVESELASLEQAGFTATAFGPRALKVETFVPYVVGMLFA